MTPPRIHLRTAGILVALVVALAVAVEVHAAPIVKAPVAKPTGMRLAPPKVCTMANRLDIFVDEDSILWECSCEALSSGFICAWRMIAGVDAERDARIHRKIELRQLPQRFYWSARWKFIRVLR